MLTVEEIETRIAGISADLKRPGISQTVRLMMHEDRKDLRRMLDAGRATLSEKDTP